MSIGCAWHTWEKGTGEAPRCTAAAGTEEAPQQPSVEPKQPTTEHSKLEWNCRRAGRGWHGVHGDCEELRPAWGCPNAPHHTVQFPPPLPGNRAHGLQQRWEESCFPEEDRTGAMKLAAALRSHLSIPVGSQHTVPAQPSASPTHSSMQTHSCVLKESSMHCVLLFRSLTPKAGPEHPSSRNYQRPLC